MLLVKKEDDHAVPNGYLAASEALAGKQHNVARNKDGIRVQSNNTTSHEKYTESRTKGTIDISLKPPQ